ncbi:MAG: nitrate reductase molybdenum cofactor assembly chaperone [bacterium]|nr:nitrate reductase molybdenum cofactor assembly chaperone [bacterium]
MTDNLDIYKTLARLIEYPKNGLIDQVRLCINALHDNNNEAVEKLSEFAKMIDGFSPEKLEEIYAQTFDMNPNLALDIGWHLYGDNYDRGGFLVEMKQKIREYNVPISTELPDHMTYVLPILGAMDDGDANDFAGELVLPTLEKIRSGFKDKSNPYFLVIETIYIFLTDRFAVSEGVVNG